MNIDHPASPHVGDVVRFVAGTKPRAYIGQVVSAPDARNRVRVDVVRLTGGAGNFAHHNVHADRATVVRCVHVRPAGVAS